MKEYEQIFTNFEFTFSGEQIIKAYDASNIQFECLKASIDYFESKHGRFSDFGLKFIGHFARGCELVSTETIKERIDMVLAK